ncbi:MAG TPA: hypothetical protein PKZ70_06640 [Candidatus Atribacteria bacterium]|nr:hypothetical protein [Candidatus Atribacteria bacterium]
MTSWFPKMNDARERKILVYLLVGVALFLSSEKLEAKISLLVSPSFLLVNSPSSEKVIKVQNLGDEAVRISVVNLALKEENSGFYLPVYHKSTPSIQIKSPYHFLLDPGEQREVTVKMENVDPSSEPVGVLILEVASNEDINVSNLQITFRIMVLIFCSF